MMSSGAVPAANGAATAAVAIPTAITRDTSYQFFWDKQSNLSQLFAQLGNSESGCIKTKAHAWLRRFHKNRTSLQWRPLANQRGPDHRCGGGGNRARLYVRVGVLRLGFLLRLRRRRHVGQETAAAGRRGRRPPRPRDGDARREGRRRRNRCVGGWVYFIDEHKPRSDFLINGH